LAHSVGTTTPSTNEEQQAPLPAAPSAADSASPANDDPENIAAFFSELDNLHHELMQLLHGSSASPSFTLATTDALTTDEHDRNNCINDEYDDSDREANDRDNHNDYANDGHENGYAIKDRDDKDCGDTREPAANDEQGNITAFLSELDTLHIELMQRLHSQHPEVTINVSPLCNTEWNLFHDDHMRFIQTSYPAILPTISPRTSDDHPDKPICKDQPPSDFADTNTATTNLLTQNKTELYPATDTAILPVGPVAAACNFPAAETPEYLTFLQELDELHNKLTLLLSSSTSHPSIIEPKTTPAKDATDNDVCAKIDHTTADSAQIAIEHHGKVYNDCDDNRKQANRESENRANDTSDSAKRNNDDRDKTEHKHDDRENNKQSNATRNNHKCDNQQYTPTFETTRSQTHQQRHRQTDPAPPAIMERNMPPTDNKSDATLAQLWSLLAQLEEINTQFALFLDTLTTPESSTTPSNPLCKQSTQQDAVNANMLDINMLPPIILALRK